MSFTDEQIARIAHGAAVELAIVLGAPAVPPWSSLDSNARGNAVHLVKAARFGATPEAVHTQRMQLDKTLLSFEQLPPEDRAKDFLFTGICSAMHVAADVVTQAKNDALALEEAARTTADTSFNASLPFGGAPPKTIELPQPQRPRQQPPARSEGE